MLASLTGSSCRRNTKEVFSHALAEPAVTWGAATRTCKQGKCYCKPLLCTVTWLSGYNLKFCKSKTHVAVWTRAAGTDNVSYATACMYWEHSAHTKKRHLPKSMNCFMDKGEGENLENLSTCLGIPASEPLFNKNWANLIFPPLQQTPPQLPQFMGRAVLSHSDTIRALTKQDSSSGWHPNSFISSFRSQTTVRSETVLPCSSSLHSSPINVVVLKMRLTLESTNQRSEFKLWAESSS